MADKKLRTGHIPALGEHTLSPRELRIVSLWLEGKSQDEIAKEVGMCQQGVSKAMNRPHVLTRMRELIDSGFRSADDELKALYPRAVKVLGREMGNASPGVALKAADKVLKAVGKYTQPIEARPSAEECLGRMLTELYERQATQNGCQTPSEGRKLLPERTET